ncbi:hypothetical protein L486_01064 [Kwoniella mangroviensis CBS 10435]|uniref:Peptidase A1 domain-containing protein n=1 Tax=Kwoniella mangroviensis CBS 10435 TaxID=1331196 RepID=A0A1B9J0V3_9TREE|nr:hypothetical protein L486_01064 [Kwoniella mangroviensis CBS 10435]
MTKHESSSSNPPIVGALSILRRKGAPDLAGLEERAINLKMTPHTASHHLEKKQVEPTFSNQQSTSSNDPYAFPTSTSEYYGSQVDRPSSSSDVASQYQSSWSTTSTWTSSWSGSATATATANAIESSASTVNNTESTSSDTSSASTSPSGTVSANNPITTLEVEDPSQMGTIYTIDVTVDGVELPVHIDTGSSQFWAAHDSCRECKLNGMTTINTALPSDCQGDNLITITYAMGWVKGCHVNTSIALGEDTLQSYPVLAVIEAGGGTEQLGGYYSGLIGLASAGLNQNDIPTVVSALYKQGSIQQPIVGFYLPRASDNQESEITFGDPATSEYADGSKVVYLSRQGGQNENYIVRMDSFVVGSETISQGTDCYLDTGSSGIAVPQNVLEQVYETAYGLNSANSTESPPCQAPSSNSGVWVTFGGQGFEIPYQDLVYQNDDGTCGALITSYSGDVSNIWLFGDSFLHNVYHSVNVETGEVELFGLKNATNSQ